MQIYMSTVIKVIPSSGDLVKLQVFFSIISVDVLHVLFCAVTEALLFS